MWARNSESLCQDEVKHPSRCRGPFSPDRHSNKLKILTVLEPVWQLGVQKNQVTQVKKLFCLSVCLFIYKEIQDGIPGFSGRDEPSSNLLHITKDWILAHRSGQRHSKSSPHSGVFNQNFSTYPQRRLYSRIPESLPPWLERKPLTHGRGKSPLGTFLPYQVIKLLGGDHMLFNNSGKDEDACRLKSER